MKDTATRTHVDCLPASFLLFFSDPDVSTLPSYLAADCSLSNELFNVTVSTWTEDEDSGERLELRQIVVGVVLALFAAFTVAGNSLVMAAVVCEPCLRNNVTNYFIVSLAVADLIIGAVVMPFSIVLEASDGWWPFGADWCDIWHSLDVLASTASILNLSVIALDRYWAITDPITYPTRMSTGRAALFIGLLWICSAAISFPAIAWWRHVAAATEAFTCAFTDDSAYLILSSFISFYAPVSIILYAYYRIYCAAAAQLRSIERGSKVMTTASYRDGVVHGREMTTLRIHRGGASTSMAGSATDRSDALDVTPGRTSSIINEPATACRYASSTSLSVCNRSATPRRWKTLTVCRQRLSRVSRERKAAKTLGIVMGVFCACWVPFFVTNLLYGLCRHVSCVQHAEILFRVFTWLGYINSGMNPVIYACSMRDFRRAFARRLICTGCCCCAAVRLTAGYDQSSSFASVRFVRNRDGGRQDYMSTSFMHSAN